MSSRKAFVAGWPVAHSRSPLIHRFWLERHGIEGDYVRQAVPPDTAEDFFRGFGESGFAGGNVTIPHKEAAFRACDRVTPVARRLAAVNTLWLEAGQVHGDNTDVYGFTANLDERAPGWRSGTTALLLGAGGASRAVIQALIDAGFGSVVVLNRTLARAAALAAKFGASVQAAPLEHLDEWVPRADIVINATSAGMDGQGALDVDWSAARPGALATDLVYVPLMTPFLQAASKKGIETVDGLGMLMHQAVPGFERWFGVRPTADDELRRRLVADLER